MKLLIITQKVDKNDPILGFFHRWIEEFSKYFESIMVICLYKGEYSLPNKYIWSERKNYDKVFVHMNQEYIILGGIIWKMLGKNIFMWRNHHAGSFLTDIVAALCKKVFCTSRFSYTAKYKKTVFMPVGVDIERFKPNNSINRIPQSILSIGRISPSKNLDLLIDANIQANIYGDPTIHDQSYYEKLKRKAGNLVKFYKGVSNSETIDIYSANDIFVNLSSSGMYDKTIFEAMACGCVVLASNDNLRGQISDDFIFKHRDLKEFTNKLKNLLNYSTENRQRAVRDLGKFAATHSLERLGERLFKEII